MFSAGGAPKATGFFAVICILQFGLILGYFNTLIKLWCLKYVCRQKATIGVKGLTRVQPGFAKTGSLQIECGRDLSEFNLG